MDVIGVMDAGGQIELAISRSGAVTQRASVRRPTPPFLIPTVHHQGVVRHRAFGVLPLGGDVVKSLTAKWRVLGKQVAVAEAASVGEDLVTSVVPDDVEIVRMLVCTGVEGRAEGQIPAVRQGAGPVGLWGSDEGVTAVVVRRGLL